MKRNMDWLTQVFQKGRGHNTKMLGVLAFALAFSVSGSAIAATTYVAGADLADAETAGTGLGEPALPVNGVWAYGTSGTVAGVVFTPFPASYHSDVGAPFFIPGDMQGWFEAGGDQVPSVMVNTTDGVVSSVLGIYDPQTFWVHPDKDDSGEYVVVRWTAPAQGSANISAEWIARASCATGVTTHIRGNGTQIIGADGIAQIPNTLVAVSVSDVEVEAGDTIDFMTGPNGFYNCDSTQFDATITFFPGATDEDGDGVDDLSFDLCLSTAGGDPVDAMGCSDAQVDGDGDGVCSPGASSTGPSACTGSDNCPDNANAGQDDLDEDGVGDVCDDDADGDGDPAGSDCDDLDPTRYAGATEIYTDGVDNNCNGQIDEQAAGADCDADGVPNEQDNCPLDYNEFQEDLDGDGLGDVCDDDIDGDDVPNDGDNCPVNANPDQADFDGDGAGDVCDADADGDGLDDATADLCLGTTTDPIAGVPSKSLGKNRWAEMDGNAQFDTNGNNPTGRMFSVYTTGGCGCAQIIEICGYGQGHTKFGCSNSVMDWWTGLYDREGEAPFQCKGD